MYANKQELYYQYNDKFNEIYYTNYGGHSSAGRTPDCGSGCRGFKSLWSPHGWVCPAARAADCKSVTKKHRRFESCPIHLCLRVREAYGAALLMRCAETHRRFKSFRRRYKRSAVIADLLFVKVNIVYFGIMDIATVSF